MSLSLRGFLRGRVGLGMLLTVLSAGCGDPAPVTAPTSPTPPTPTSSRTAISLAVTLAGDSPIVVGSTRQLVATVTYSTGETQAITDAVTWRSSNTEVATISETGVATAHGVGVADLSAALSEQVRGTLSADVRLPVSPQAALKVSGGVVFEGGLYVIEDFTAVKFDAGESTGDGLTYRFDFGDGTDNRGSSSQASHHYGGEWVPRNSPRPSLTVTDRYNRTSTASAGVFIVARGLCSPNFYWTTEDADPIYVRFRRIQECRHTSYGLEVIGDGYTASLRSDTSVQINASGVTYAGKFYLGRLPSVRDLPNVSSGALIDVIPDGGPYKGKTITLVLDDGF